MKLEIDDVHIEIGGNKVVNGTNLDVSSGELHVIMGPNGCGKSSLAKGIMGHPDYKISSGSIKVDGKEIKDLPANERAKLGLFLQFQEPVEIDGLGILNFLNAARNSLNRDNKSVREFMNEVKERSSQLKLKEELVGRSLNSGFSGGEKKKVEVLQMQILKPGIAILDEPDSGLDVDAVRIVAENIKQFMKETGAGVILITHYSRILEYLEPDQIHIMKNGRIIMDGGTELVHKIEKEGYENGD
jgi:Fe-S cluster assembly ATP-binding protein